MKANTLKKILKIRSFDFTQEEIKNIMDEELEKDPDELDTDLVDMCLELLDDESKPKPIEHENLTFGEAINLLTHYPPGVVTASRAGWYDNIAFIIMNEYNDIKCNNDKNVKVDPYITAITPNLHCVVGWVPTQADMFANDWCVAINGGNKVDAE